MLEDHLIIFIAGLIAIGSNERYRTIAVILFCSFFVHEIFYDIIITKLNLRQESAVYVSYAAINIVTLALFAWLNASKTLKTLVSLNMIINSLAILQYIIITNFGVMDFNLHVAYNPIVWSLMLAQILVLLWMEKDVVNALRKQGYILRNYCHLHTVVRSMRSIWNANRSPK